MKQKIKLKLWIKKTRNGAKSELYKKKFNKIKITEKSSRIEKKQKK